MTDALLARGLVAMLAIAPLGLLQLPDPAASPNPARTAGRQEAATTAATTATTVLTAPMNPAPQLRPRMTAHGTTPLPGPEARRLRGHVVGPRGQPVAAALVQLVPQALGAPKQPSRSPGELPGYLHEEAPALVAAVGDLAATGLGVVPGEVPALPAVPMAMQDRGASADAHTIADATGWFEVSFKPTRTSALWITDPATGATVSMPVDATTCEAPLQVTLETPAPARAAHRVSSPAPAAPTKTDTTPRLFTLPAVEFDTRMGGVFISELGASVADSPLRVGDRVLRIGGEPVLAASQARAMLRGKRHSSVRLVLLRDGARIRTELKRP